MTREYRIALHTKTASGFEKYAEFFVGDDPATARQLFNRLKGSKDQIDGGILLMELREICRGLPLDMQFKSCTLDELAENCRIITREIFALNNFGPAVTREAVA